MSITWVMVCPVDNSTFRIPLVFTIERYGIPGAQSADPGRQIDVMSHQHCLPGIEPSNEPLVPRSINIISQQLRDNAFSLYLEIALSVVIGVLESIVSAPGP